MYQETQKNVFEIEKKKKKTIQQKVNKNKKKSD